MFRFVALFPTFLTLVSIFPSYCHGQVFDFAGNKPAIVGGNPVTTNYPFYVVSGSNRKLCGGSLIHEDIVLTVAHCEFDPIFSSGVYIGGTEFNPWNGDFFDVDAFLEHPDYDPIFFGNDIMLLRLGSPATQNSIVDLNFDADVPQLNDALTVIGHGLQDPNDSTSVSTSLLEVNVNYVDCPNNFFVDENLQMCAGVDGGGKDSCGGDSGGPLLSNDMKQVGLVSVGFGCAVDGSPGIYTRLSGYRNWIEDGICSLSRNPPLTCPGVTSSPTSVANVPPTSPPTGQPTSIPTTVPSDSLLREPTRSPTISPTMSPTNDETNSPTDSRNPSQTPFATPTRTPTNSPTSIPTFAPTSSPSAVPTQSVAPSLSATEEPTRSPTKARKSMGGRKRSKGKTKAPVSSPSNYPTKSPILPSGSTMTLAPTKPTKKNRTKVSQLFLHFFDG